MATFADQVGKWVIAAQATLEAAMADSIEEVGRRLIARTPIDTGRLVSNWNYSLESPDSRVVEQFDVRQVNGLEDLPATPTRFTHYICNGTPYAYYVEVGTSRMSPRGMVSLTAIEWSDIVEKSALKYARGIANL